MEHSPQQLEALERIRFWYKEWTADRFSRLVPQTFKLFGYAGTGKTTLAKSIGAGKQVTMFAAYTGKAAQVLTSKGVPATTLHKLIYKPNGERVEYERDEHGVIKVDGEGKPIRKKGVKPQPFFVLDPDSPLFFADLLVVDEVSMVNTRLGEDILSFGKPTLVLGDPAQLPPVEGGGFFTKEEPDYLLTEIHRQAEGSEVLKLATAIRSGDHFSRVARVNYRDAAQFDQVIVGTNKSRWTVNETIRDVLGLPWGKPVAGDKIIVLQNNYDLDVMNGETYQVLAYDELSGAMEVRDDFGAERWMNVWQQGFTADGEAQLKNMDYRDQKRRVMATFAWAITCHKAQGSQWGTVLVVDESAAFRGSRQRWLYTAVTRAADEVHIINPTGLYRHQIKPRPRRK